MLVSNSNTQIMSLPPLHLLRLCAPVSTLKREAENAKNGPGEKRQKTENRLRFGLYPAWEKDGIAREIVDLDQIPYRIEPSNDLPTKPQIIRPSDGQPLCRFWKYMISEYAKNTYHFVCAFDTSDYVALSPSEPPRLVGIIAVFARMSPEDWSNAALVLLDDPDRSDLLSPNDRKRVLSDEETEMSFELSFICTNNGKGPYKRGDPLYIPGILRGMVRAVERMVVRYWVEKARDDYVAKMKERDPDYEDGHTFDTTLDRLLRITVLTLTSADKESVRTPYERVEFKAETNWAKTGKMFKFGDSFHDYS